MGAGVAVLALVGASDPTVLQVRSPVTVAELRGEIVGDLASFGRGLLLLVLGAGTLLVAVVVLADTLVRRTDIGRRRALGAPRWAVVTIVVGRTTTAAVLGALVGTGVTSFWLQVTGTHVSVEFTSAIAILAVLAATLGALAPAMSAAWQDSVTVLRTP